MKVKVYRVEARLYPQYPTSCIVIAHYKRKPSIDDIVSLLTEWMDKTGLNIEKAKIKITEMEIELEGVEYE